MTVIQQVRASENHVTLLRKPEPLRSIIDRKCQFFFIKRLLDVSVSSLLIVFVLSWLLPLVAIFIIIESRGPILFIQRRVGKGGKSFRCLKFRTMVVNGDANTKQAQLHDRRITKVGQFLRISNLDEFPQFFNVFVGDMSLVGPRPHMHSDCAQFSAIVSGYKFRNMVKPGITGLAQVKGYRGPTKDFASVFHRYQLDAFYIRNANVWLDLRIIRKTAGQTLQALGRKMLSFSVGTPQSQKRWVAVFRSLLS